LLRRYKDLARLHGIVPPDLPSGHRYRRVETGVPGVSILEDFLSQDEHDLFVAMAEEERVASDIRFDASCGMPSPAARSETLVSVGSAVQAHAAMQGAPGK
jgi:hypothetical protein